MTRFLCQQPGWKVNQFRPGDGLFGTTVRPIGSTRSRAPEVVGDIFRSLVPFAEGGSGISRIAMPIVASGFQEESVLGMLEAIVKAAIHWLSHGLSLECIKIVVRVAFDTADEEEYGTAFARAKQTAFASEQATGDADPHRYDVFVSYAHDDWCEVQLLIEEMHKRRPALRVFLDRLELQPGMPWQQHLFDALDDCRKVVSLLSPPYLASKVCKEEFNIALLRHRESSEEVLIPLYLYSASLPTYMRMVQHIDGREGDREKLVLGAQVIVDRL
jgi:hypothetical protein